MAFNSYSPGSGNAGIMQRKKQDEKNSQLLRELLTLPTNKKCFECGQRGPTYANITIGAFCCMHCSGLLRGLNPPHRVKSISMATFSDEDLDRLRRMGNEENARTWLGLQDSGKGEIVLGKKSEDEMRQYLMQKYEQRKWYVSPNELTEQKRLLEEYSGSKRNEFSASPSILSHQSNKSAPANLHATAPSAEAPQQQQLSLMDLLADNAFFPNPSSGQSGSLGSVPTSSSVSVTSPQQSTYAAADPVVPMVNQIPTQQLAASQSSLLSPHRPQPAVPHSSTVSFPAPPSVHHADVGQEVSSTHQQQQHWQSNFADFDSMNFRGEPTSAEGSNLKSTSAFTLGQRPPPPPLPQSQPVVWPAQLQPVNAEEKNAVSKSDWLADNFANLSTTSSTTSSEAKAKGVNNGNKTGGEEIDYSALEELYHGSSQPAQQQTFPAQSPPAFKAATAQSSFASSLDFDPFGSGSGMAKQDGGGWGSPTKANHGVINTTTGVIDSPIYSSGSQAPVISHVASSQPPTNWNPFA